MKDVARQARIDSYDFFGYFVPGLIFVLLSIYAVVAHYMGKVGFFDIKLLQTKEIVVELWVAIVVCVVGSVVAYVVSHIVAIVSAIFFEKIAISKIFGDPWKHMILTSGPQLDDKKYYSFVVSSAYFVLMVFQINMKPVMFCLNDVAMFFDAKLWVSVFVCSIFSLRFVRFLISDCDINAFKVAGNIIRIIIDIFATPQYFIVFKFQKMIERFVGNCDKFPDAMIGRIYEVIEKCYRCNKDDCDSELFWMAYWKVMRSDSVVRERLDKFLALYGFMRNMAAVCLIASGVMLHMSTNSTSLAVESFVLMVLSVAFFVRFFYLYSHYYTKLVFRAVLLQDGVIERSSCEGDEERV